MPQAGHHAILSTLLKESTLIFLPSDHPAFGGRQRRPPSLMLEPVEAPDHLRSGLPATFEVCLTSPVP